jgi:xylulose-5-phosphate/fructose-6-phosphate phosphoketolase
MTPATVLSADERDLIDAYWRAANYLSVGQIYLLDNPLLREPLEAEHVKPRLLGHFGTTPGLNFVYAHLNRAINARGLSAIYVTGPGHGGPGLVANAYLEGTYAELYPHISEDEAGLRRLFRAGSRPTSRRRHRARSTREASSATRSRMPSAPRSTTPTCWSPASSATGKPRRGRSRRAGTRTSS